MEQSSRVGAPDARKRACPVRGGLGRIPLLKGSMDAVLLLHLEDLVALYLLEHQEEEAELHEHVELDNAPGRHTVMRRRAPASGKRVRPLGRTWGYRRYWR